MLPERLVTFQRRPERGFLVYDRIHAQCRYVLVGALTVPLRTCDGAATYSDGAATTVPLRTCEGSDGI